MKIIQIISEHKHIRRFRQKPDGNFVPITPPKYGFKRVEAIIEENGVIQTRHVDIQNS